MRGSRLGMMSALLLGLAAAGGHEGDPSAPRMDKRYGGRFGPYMPHQSVRECARRIGGRTWAAFKAADRERRGLPAMLNQGGK